jgi:hypothetical protein
MATEIYTDDFQEAYAEILVECWSDDEFKQRFIADPVAVFKEWDIDIAEGGIVKVLEVAEEGAVAISLPPKPQGFDELSDEDLEAVAGGFFNLPSVGVPGTDIDVTIRPKLPCK